MDNREARTQLCVTPRDGLNDSTPRPAYGDLALAWWLVLVFSAPLWSAERKPQLPSDRTLGDDIAFLSAHTPTLVLGQPTQAARVVLAPAYQGRVMTSGSRGDQGKSYGWINDEPIRSGKVAPHINVYGGEERFWLGPEGGQFSIFFAPGSEFTLQHWQTPSCIDSEPFEVVESNSERAVFRHEAHFRNYSNTQFDLRIERTVELLSPEAASTDLPQGPELSQVAYRTTNKITNLGTKAWTKETGLLSIWLLGMFKHSDQTNVVIPYISHPAGAASPAASIPIVKDDYFGRVPTDRLKVTPHAIIFRADGQFRSKIGVGPERATARLGSYDARRQVLTMVEMVPPRIATRDYVNSMWEIQSEPFAGDVLNAYNDGPPSPGAQPLGPFYELETSSPALALGPGESGEHIQTTYHWEGPPQSLDAIARSRLGVTLQDLATAFSSKK